MFPTLCAKFDMSTKVILRGCYYYQLMLLAAKVSLDTIIKEVNELKTGMQNTTKEYETHKQDVLGHFLAEAGNKVDMLGTFLVRFRISELKVWALNVTFQMPMLRRLRKHIVKLSPTLVKRPRPCLPKLSSPCLTGSSRRTPRPRTTWKSGIYFNRKISKSDKR